MSINLSSNRIWAAIEALSRMTETNRPFTRRAFTEYYLKGRAWLSEAFVAAGLDPRVDAGGNLIGRREGRQDGLPAIALGSHSDTVVGGGRFDGIAGVIAALEVAQALIEHQLLLDHPLEIIDFLAEEPTDYGPSCVGSRALAGTLTEKMLEMRNSAGESLAEAVRRMGGNPATLSRRRVGGVYRAFLELHVEQAARLERSKTAIGVVTRFTGIQRDRVIVVGRRDHAGTTPMGERLDALVAASEIVRIANELAIGNGGRGGFVATIGQLQVRPGATNVVPGEVELTLDARSLDQNDLRAFVGRVLADGRAILEPHGFRVVLEPVSHVKPVACSGEIQEVLVHAAERRSLRYLLLPSGAGHDAMHMTQICPSGMVLVPSRGGRSHCPEEDTSPEEIRAGAEVLLEAVLRLDRSLQPGDCA